MWGLRQIGQLVVVGVFVDVGEQWGGEVVFVGIGQYCQDYVVWFGVCGDVQCVGYCGVGGDVDEEVFFGCQVVCGFDGVGIVDGQQFVVDVVVEYFWYEIWGLVLDFVWFLFVVFEQGCILWFGGDDVGVWVGYFEYFIYVGQGVVCVLVGDEVVQLFVGEVMQDFWCGGVVVVGWVGWIGELVGQELVVFFGQFFCVVDYV